MEFYNDEKIIENEVMPIETENYKIDISKDRIIKLKGRLFSALEDKEARFKGLSEADILDIKHMLLEEVKRQNEEANNPKQLNHENSFDEQIHN